MLFLTYDKMLLQFFKHSRSFEVRKEKRARSGVWGLNMAATMAAPLTRNFTCRGSSGSEATRFRGATLTARSCSTPDPETSASPRGGL